MRQALGRLRAHGRVALHVGQVRDPALNRLAQHGDVLHGA